VAFQDAAIERLGPGEVPFPAEPDGGGEGLGEVIHGDADLLESRRGIRAFKQAKYGSRPATAIPQRTGRIVPPHGPRFDGCRGLSPAPIRGQNRPAGTGSAAGSVYFGIPAKKTE
jgi:hypothetical protein